MKPTFVILGIEITILLAIGIAQFFISYLLDGISGVKGEDLLFGIVIVFIGIFMLSLLINLYFYFRSLDYNWFLSLIFTIISFMVVFGVIAGTIIALFISILSGKFW